MTELTIENKTKKKLKKEKKLKRSAESDSSSVENEACSVPKKQKKEKTLEVNGASNEVVEEVNFDKTKKEKKVKLPVQQNGVSEEDETSEVPKKKKKKEKKIADANGVTEKVEEEKELSPEEKEGAFSNFRISPETVTKLKESGVGYLFPVQSKTFDHVYDGFDLITKARTGTGKTFAFALPLVEILMKNLSKARGRPPKVLCMVPTRELASQVAGNFTKISPRLDVLCVYGGTPYYPQESALSRGVDVVVGTPGRINDLVEKNRLNLKCLEHAVLDEVDRMLDMGFADIVDQILQVAYTDREKNPQTLLFSATLPSWVYDTAKKYMNEEVKTIDLVGQRRVQTSTTVQHLAIRCGYHDRAAIIGDIVKMYSGNHGRAMVFCETKRDADELTVSPYIKQETHVLHGDIPQDKREMVLKGFREGRYKCLITTDVAARGLDIPEVDLVVQTCPPKDVDSYIHRSGRTGRAGRMGTCVCFYKPYEDYSIQTLERRTGLKFKHVGPPTTEDLVKAARDDSIRALDNIDPKIVSLFEESAEKLISERGAVSVLSAALAIISGSTDMKSRSLLCSKEGYTTYVYKTTVVMNHVSYAWKALEHHIPAEVRNKILGMRFCADKMGCAFDVPTDLVSIVEESWQDNANNSLEKATELPELAADQGGPRGGGGRRGGFGRGGFGQGRFQGNGQGGRFGNRSSFNGRGSYGGNRGGSRNFTNRGFNSNGFGSGGANKRTTFD